MSDTGRRAAAGREILSPPTVIGLALAVAAIDPASWPRMSGTTLAFSVIVALLFALWAAPAVVQRPVEHSHTWTGRTLRHRNTVFAATCAAVAGLGDPPVWLMAVDAALLLAYLLAVDALAAGPIGARQLRGVRTPAAAAAASAAVLIVAEAPVDGGAVWGRIVAALCVAAAASAAGLALWGKARRRG